MDMRYGLLGSLFRSGSRQTQFASQVTRFADIYSSSHLNLLHYPFFYLFKAPAMLMPHESTVDRHDEIKKDTITYRHLSDHNGADNNSSKLHRSVSIRPDTPNQITHHADFDDDDDEESDENKSTNSPNISQ
jgi:5'-nucleotidase